MTPEQHAMLYNASSVIGHMAMGDGEAPVLDMSGKPMPSPLKIVRPTVTLSAADIEAIATAVAPKLAALLPTPEAIAKAVADEDHRRSAA